jgi:hypothetical protein
MSSAVAPHSVRFADTSPPLDGGEEAPAAMKRFLPLPPEGGEVVCEANRSGGTTLAVHAVFRGES